MVSSNDNDNIENHKDDKILNKKFDIKSISQSIKKKFELLNNNLKEDYNNKNIISKLFSKFKQVEEIEARETLKDYAYEYSKFREYIFLLEESEDDENVLLAIELCDDALKLDRHRFYLNRKRKELETTLEDLKCYDNLTEDESEELKNLINKFVQLNNERRSIRYQIGDFNSSINKLEELKDDAYDAIYQIEDAENSKRLLSRDIELIKDEKERTLLDREKLQFAYNIIYKFSFVISIILGLSIIILTLLYMTMGENVFLPLSILCFTLIFIIALIYAFRKKIVFELKLNEKKQSKLITLLNKKTVVYSYYVNFLNFAYKKYNVKNSRILRANLEDFNNYKYLTSRYDNLGNISIEVQRQLEKFLIDKNISISNISLDSFAKSINIDNKIYHFKEINMKKQKIEKRISEIDKEHEEVWEKLVELNLNDTSNEKVIEKIMKAYLNETEKILLDDEYEKDIDKLEEDL